MLRYCEDVQMSEEFGGDLYTITDDEGNDYVLEHLDTIEQNGIFYLAFLPTDIEEEDDDYGIVILKRVEENGEELLVSIDNDDDLLENLYAQFVERLLDEDDE